MALIFNWFENIRYEEVSDQWIISDSDGQNEIALKKS